MAKAKISLDAVYKKFFSNPYIVKSFLQDFVPGDYIEDLDFSTLERLSGNYVSDTLNIRSNDIVWQLQWKNTRQTCYLVVMLEFQSSTNYWMALRMNAYTTLLLQDLIATRKLRSQTPLPIVLPIVIYNGKRQWNAPRDVADLFGANLPKELLPYIPSQRHFLLDISRFPEEILDKLHGVAAQIVKLEREKNITPLMKVYHELLTQIQGPEYTDVCEVLHIWVLEYLLGRMGITEDLSHLNLQELGVVLENRAEEWKKMFLAEGRAEGKAEGKAEEKLQFTVSLRKRVIEDLKLRFGPLPSHLIASIEMITDPYVLVDFVVLASTANSLQNFEVLSKRNRSVVKE